MLSIKFEENPVLARNYRVIALGGVTKVFARLLARRLTVVPVVKLLTLQKSRKGVRDSGAKGDVMPMVLVFVVCAVGRYYSLVYKSLLV